MKNNTFVATVNIPSVDQSALSDINKEADGLAKEFFQLNKDMNEILNKISAASVCYLQTYDDSVENLSSSIVKSVELQEKLIMKARTLSSEMKPVYELQSKINNLKRSVDLLDSLL